MLKKILTIALVLAMVVAFGCKKASTTTQTKNSVNVKQAEKNGQMTTETVKKEVVKTVEEVNAK